MCIILLTMPLHSHHHRQKEGMMRSLRARRLSLAAAIGLFLTCFTGILNIGPAMANPVYRIVDSDNDPYTGIYLRNGTTMANVTRIASRYVVYNNTAELLCGTWGEAVGPYANRRWHQVRVTTGATTGQVGWMPDRYMNTPNAANQPTPGEPECGATPPPIPPSGVAQRVWGGSPVVGYWDYGTPSPPSVHHFLSNASDYGDWALDIGGPGVGGQDVLVYIAPDNGAPNVTTRVDQIGAACGYGRNGASFVTVGIYQANGMRIGSITYGHIIPSVSKGAAVSRWGGKVGKVATGLPYNTACWTGAHVHVQMFSNKNYACYNGTYRHAQAMYRSNFIGRTGGNVASGIRRACA